MAELFFRERLSPREIADALGVSHMTVYRALRGIAIVNYGGNLDGNEDFA